MKLKQTKLMLVGAAMAIALPTTLALSQQDRPGTPPPGGQPGQPQQQPQQPGQDPMNGVQRDQMSPEQLKQASEKWFKHAASSNQFEIEVSRLAMERFGGGGMQPGMRGDQPRQPGAHAGTGQQPQPGAGGGAQPAGGTGGQQPGAGGGAQPAGGTGGQQPGAGGGAQPAGQQPGMAGQDGMQPQGMPGDQKQQLVQVAQMIERDHTQALQDLRQRAQQEGVQISESPELSPVHRAKLDDLREKQGDDFVRAFVFGNMASHTHGILEYTWAQQHGPSQQIKEYARATLPRIQAHAQQIAPIAYEIAGVTDARTAGERMGQEQRDRPSDRGTGAGQTDRPPGGAGGGAGGSERPDGA